MQFAIQVGNPTILQPETNPSPDLAYAIAYSPSTQRI